MDIVSSTCYWPLIEGAWSTVSFRRIQTHDMFMTEPSPRDPVHAMTSGQPKLSQRLCRTTNSLIKVTESLKNGRETGWSAIAIRRITWANLQWRLNRARLYQPLIEVNNCAPKVANCIYKKGKQTLLKQSKEAWLEHWNLAYIPRIPIGLKHISSTNSGTSIKWVAPLRQQGRAFHRAIPRQRLKKWRIKV